MNIHRYADVNKVDNTLRPYQQKAKREIFESWDEVDSVMFQMPTGTGKTRLFTSIIRDINDYSKLRMEPVRILIIAHRTELIDQIDASLDRYKVAHNVIAGGKERDPRKPVHVASIQTLTHPNNLERAKRLNVQFVIIDEAHHALAKTYKKLWDLYPNAKRLGVTATPWRMNHQGFTDLFDRLVLSMPIKDFIRDGYLAPYKYFSLKGDSDIRRTIEDIEIDKWGEYKEDSMEEKMDIGSIRAQLLDSYQSLADGKKGIIYAINIVHAKHICEEYKAAGYRVVCIDSKTPAAERNELVKKFKRGLIDIIVNVDIFSEGFDCPDIEFIQLARPTRSLVKYLQQVGRGLRPTENKQNCVILDNVGMYSNFGLPDARRHWRHHFQGKKIDETPTSFVSRGTTGGGRPIDFTEGTEDMELIQDVNDLVEDVTEVEVQDVVAEELPQEVEAFDPTPILDACNYKGDNFIFWFNDTKKIYESYIQDDTYFIVSEIVPDVENHTFHRIRVGKIPMESWMFWQFEREKVDNLKSIQHFGGNYTVFRYYVLDRNNIKKDKYFDYKGGEIDAPSEVEDNFSKVRQDGQVNDYIDLPVSKATFKAELRSNLIIIFKTIEDSTTTIAVFPKESDFGKRFMSPRGDKFTIYRSNDDSFTVRCEEDDNTFLYKYDLNGVLIKKGTIAKAISHNKPQLTEDDTDKLMHVFDKKSTSYKYFWFLAIMQLYKERNQAEIPFKDIIVRMVANAWPYINNMRAVFPQSDQLPIYVNRIVRLNFVTPKFNKKRVEERLMFYYDRFHIESILSPLLKNVPYRFLSPWIPYKSDEDVIEKSKQAETRCLYRIKENSIVINQLWREYLTQKYDSISRFAEKELETYLKVDNEESVSLYDKQFPTLSSLLKEMKRQRKKKEVIDFVDKHDWHPIKDITPTDILMAVPRWNVYIDMNGKKVIKTPQGKWSLRILDELLKK